jgi:hypothetical protein
MSMDSLRNTVRRELNERLDEVTSNLTTRQNDPASVMHTAIGEIKGLRLALEVLDTTYRELN